MSARILVVDEGEFASGATGRNGAGFRMQWGLELNIRLCQESIGFFERAAEELDYAPGIELKQDGYLVLAHSAKALASLKAAVDTQHRFGADAAELCGFRQAEHERGAVHLSRRRARPVPTDSFAGAATRPWTGQRNQSGRIEAGGEIACWAN